MGLLEAPLGATYVSTTKLKFQFWPMVVWAILVEPKFHNAISPRWLVASCCSSVTKFSMLPILPPTASVLMAPLQAFVAAINPTVGT